MNQIRQGYCMSEGEDRHPISLFKANPIPVCTNFKYFGTLGSIPSLAFLNQKLSKPEIDSTALSSVPNLNSTFSECFSCKESAIRGEPERKVSVAEFKVPESTLTACDGYSLVNERSVPLSTNPYLSSLSSRRLEIDTIELKSTEGDLGEELQASASRITVVASLIQNIRVSILTLKAKNAISAEECQLLRSMENELSENLKEYKKIQSHIRKISEISPDLANSPSPSQLASERSIEPKNVRRIIVCDTTPGIFQKVIMCDNNREVLSMSCDMDSENSKSVNSSCQMSTANNDIKEHNVQIQIDFDREPPNDETSNRSSSHYSWPIPPRPFPSSRQHRCSPSQTDAALLHSGTNPTKCTDITHFGQSSPDASIQSSYYQTTENSHVCYYASIPPSYASSCQHLPSGSDWMDCESSMNVSDSTGSCPHPPSNTASTIVPQQMQSNLMKSVSQFMDSENRNRCRASGGSCNKHEDSRTLLKSLSKDYKNTKNAMLLKTLEEENEKLKQELRKMDMEKLQLNKRIKCMQFEADLKSKDNLMHSSQSSQQNRDLKLHELSNSISNIQRNIEVYCSCLTGNRCHLQTQLEEMERELCQVKKLVSAAKRENRDKSVVQQPVEDAKDIPDCSMKDSGKKETALIPKTSEQFHSNPSSQITNEHSNQRNLNDGSITDSKTDSPEIQNAADLQNELVKVKRQNEIILESVKENLVSESNLNTQVRELESVILTLKEHLQKQCSCENQRRKGWMNSLNCASCCGGNRSCGSEYQFPPEETDAEEVNRQLCKRTEQIRELSEELEQSNKMRMELVNDLEHRIKLIQELGNELKKREGAVTCLESKLASDRNKIIELQNQLCQREKNATGSEQNSFREKDSKNNAQNYENRIKELEAELKKVKDSKVDALKYENKIKELEAELKEVENSKVEAQNYESKIKELETELKRVEASAKTRESLVTDLTNKLKLAEDQISKFQEELKNYEVSMKELQGKLCSTNNKFRESEAKFSEAEKQLKFSNAKICALEDHLQSGCAKIVSLEEQLSCNKRTILELSSALIVSESKVKDLDERLGQSQDEINALYKQANAASYINKTSQNDQNLCSTELVSLQEQLLRTQEQLSELMCERDLLLKVKGEAGAEIEDLKLNTKRLEITNFSLAREIAAEVERIKASITDKLSNFSPLIGALEKTRAELQETQSLFEDAENRCSSLNQKLKQTNNELRTLKAMKQPETVLETSTVPNHESQNICSLESQHQVLLSEACESLNMLNNEKLQLKSAVESLINENKGKDEQLSRAFVEVEELRKEVCTLKKLAEEKK